MDSCVVHTCAKLNLMLDCLGKRTDGYHNLDMIMQSVDLCDTVTLQLTNDFSVTCSGVDVPDESNLAVRAAKAYFEAFPQPSYGVSIAIEKKIPMLGGLGGGSADAAAVLCGLARLLNNRDAAGLMQLAQTLGSDVPFAMVGGTVHAQGRGERLQPLADMPACYVVIVMCSQKESTGHAFAVLDHTEIPLHPDITGFVAALKTGELAQIAPLCSNVFSVLYQFDDMAAVMRRYGALGVSLSGAGPAVFGIFSEADDAKDCAEQFSEALVCRMVDKSIFFE